MATSVEQIEYLKDLIEQLKSKIANSQGRIEQMRQGADITDPVAKLKESIVKLQKKKAVLEKDYQTKLAKFQEMYEL